MIKKFYGQMLLIRLFERKIEELFTKGLLFGTTHACIGQEAVAVGVTSALKKSDLITSNHRGHGHFIAFTGDVEGLMSEIMGKATGVCAGRSGSQHLCSSNFFSNGITGGMTPVATGMALAEKLNKKKNLVAAFFGDGALGEGVIYESMNIASLWKLPILYVLENNQYAMSTHISSGIAGSMAARGKAFGIETDELSTNDVEIIASRTAKVVAKIRKTSRPHLLIINTYRLCGHSKSDDLNYRARKEENAWQKKDPIKLLGKKLDRNTKEKILTDCTGRIDAALKAAQDAPFPAVDTLYEGSFR